MYFFTSDTHLGDQGTFISDLRPYKNARVLAKKMIKMWNRQAKRGDTIYIVGDFIDCDGEGFDGWKEYLLWVKKIKADVVLITGNNEDRVVKFYFNSSFEDFKNYCISIGFKNVCENLNLNMLGQNIYLTHKPADCKKEMMNIFGHVHAAGGIYRPFGINVGCDLFGYRLLSEIDIKHLLNKKEKYWNKDKHLNWCNKD